MKKYLGKLFKYGSKYASKIWKATSKVFSSPAAKTRGTWFWRAIAIADLSVWGWDMISDDDEAAQTHLQKLIVDQILNEPVLVLLHSEDIEDASAVRYAFTMGGMQLTALPGQLDILRGQALILAARYHEETMDCRTYKYATIDQLGDAADMVASRINGEPLLQATSGTVLAGLTTTTPDADDFSLKTLLGELAEASELDPVIHRNLDFLVWYFTTTNEENPEELITNS